MKQYHYVYKIINTVPIDNQKYYIGVRTSKVSPEKDVKYMGSSTPLKNAIKFGGIENFKKEILSVWETREYALNEEIRLHELYDVSRNTEYYNKVKSISNGFTTVGLVPVIDVRTGLTKLVVKEELKNTDFYQHCTKGFVTVFDTKDNVIKSISVNEYNSSDQYITAATGKVSVIDIRNGTTVQVTTKEFYEFDYYVRQNKGCVLVFDVIAEKYKLVSKMEYEQNEFFKHVSEDRVTVLDIRDGKNKVVTKREFDAYDFYVSPNSKKISVYRVDGTLFGTSYGNFDDFCKKHKLSRRKLTESYKNNGCPIFVNCSENTLKQLERNSTEFQIGWYAKEIIEPIKNPAKK